MSRGLYGEDALTPLLWKIHILWRFLDDGKELQSPELSIYLISLKMNTDWIRYFFSNGMVFWLMTVDLQLRREKSHIELHCRPVEMPELWFSISEIRDFTHFPASFYEYWQINLLVTVRYLGSKWCKAPQVLQHWVWNPDLCGPSTKRQQGKLLPFFPLILSGWFQVVKLKYNRKM